MDTLILFLGQVQKTVSFVGTILYIQLDLHNQNDL